MPELFKELPQLFEAIQNRQQRERQLGMVDTRARESMAMRERELGSRESTSRISQKIQMFSTGLEQIINAGKISTDPGEKQKLAEAFKSHIQNGIGDPDIGQMVRQYIPADMPIVQKPPELTEALTETGETILTPKREGLITKAAPEKKYPGIVGEYYTVYGKVPTSSDDIKKFKEATQLDTDSYGTIQKGLDEQGKMVFFQIDKTTGTPRVVKGLQPEPKKGMKVTTPDGTIVEIGGSGDIDITKKTQGTIEEKLINIQDARVRAEKIRSEFNPEFLTYGAKLSQLGLNIKEKWNADSLTPEQKNFVVKISTFRQDAIENINLYIKAITGAQMSEAEANRLRQAVADAGNGIFSGDGPTQFLAKIDNALKKGKLAEARYKLLLEKGFNENELKADLNEANKLKTNTKIESSYSYDKIEKMLKEKAEEIGSRIEFQNPKLPQDEIAKQVRMEMNKRYGI